MTKETSKLDHNTAALKRWRTRLQRAMTMVGKLEKQRMRIEKKMTQAEQLAEPVLRKLAGMPKPEGAVLVPSPPAKDDLAIPAFLDRAKPDPATEQIRQQIKENIARKARGRIERMKAKQRGDLKKMPLTGKAALAAIRNA